MTFESVSYDGSPKKFVDETLENMKTVDGNVFSFVSGGVDSVTSTAIVYRAVGDRAHSIIFEHGGMRKNEPQKMADLIRENCFPITLKDYTGKFMPVVIAAREDAEEKRKAIRDRYFDLAIAETKKPGAKYFVQGTNRADEDEVLRRLVKTQHNVVTNPLKEKLEKNGIEVIEPVKKLYKDEVREVARYLGLPPEITERQPFLGPGLYCRIVGQVSREKMKILTDIDHMVTPKLEKFSDELGLMTDKQCFCGLMEKNTSHPIAALGKEFPRKLDNIKIRNPKITESKVTGMNTQGERTYKQMLIFDSDAEISDLINISEEIVDFDEKIGRCATTLGESYWKGSEYIIMLRAISTQDFTTASALPLKRNDMERMADEILEMKQVKSVVYDVTNKPPATIEWE